MSVTQEQIENLSKNLSKISVNNEKLTGDINGILNYIDLLNEINTDGVSPTISVVKTKNTLREDKYIKNISTNELLKCSNQKIIANQIAINNIMK